MGQASVNELPAMHRSVVGSDLPFSSTETGSRGCARTVG
jgi:hypothetical protein